MKKRTKRILTILATIGMIMVAQTVLAANGEVDIKTLDISKLKLIFSNVYWAVDAIGATIIMTVGLVHSILLSTAAKNGNKKAMAYEALGTVFVSIFFFFTFPTLAGILKGLATSAGAQ